MEQVSTNSSTVENNAKKLGLRELTSLAAGQVIGAGIVTLVGQAIGLTGRSVWLAYLTAVIIGFVIIIPYIMLSSMIRVKGGNYSFVASILGEKWGGMYGMAFTLNALACGMFGLAFATYLNSMVPGLNTKIVAVVVVTVFYVVNLMGVNFMAKIQSYMTITLFLGLGLFIVVGFTNLRPGTFAFSSPDFFTNGADGFIAAVLILIFSCTGHSFVVAYSGDSKKPRKDIPLAIILASGIILVLYTSVALVAGGVVPIKEAAGQPLTIVATKILGNPLSYIFVIGGPLAALTTTLNSSFGVFSKPVLQMSKDGWFPSRFARLNRYGSPYLVLTVLYAMAVIPVIAGL
ncbi:MAG: APC family permease, partial [Bacillota bacterium]